jgi:TonB family protein
MIVEGLLLASLSAVPQASPAGQTSTDCSTALARGNSAAAVEVCLGEDQLKLADAAPRGGTERARLLEAAAEHYRRAEALAPNSAIRIRAFDALARVFDAQHLNDLAQLEPVLRELAALEPDDLERLYRLAKVQEDQDSFDAAEATLITARQRQPDSVEPYKMLAQLYLRRATALAAIANRQSASDPTGGAPGKPDQDGIYRVGGGIAAPARRGVPRMPQEATAAGIQGVVIVEVVVDESGAVTEPRILRSIPLLDEAALSAVREWRFEPTIVDGRPVPVRMTLTVNFTNR